MNLYVTAYTPMGTFEGRVNAIESDSLNEVTKARDWIQSNIHQMNHVVIYSGDSEITLAGELVRNSVLVFTIREGTKL